MGKRKRVAVEEKRISRSAKNTPLGKFVGKELHCPNCDKVAPDSSDYEWRNGSVHFYYRCECGQTFYKTLNIEDLVV